MSNDHHAYQRAAQVAGFGLLLQTIIGLTLLLFGILSVPNIPADGTFGSASVFRADNTFIYGSMYVLLGTLVWISLIIIFYQHKLERLEALEHDELASTRTSGSVFDDEDDEVRVAGRRLRLMHRWLMPAVSLVLTAGLGLLAWWMLARLNAVDDALASFNSTPYRGWAVSICLAVAVVTFIFSRFVAGMSKLSVWQNLRGGAGFMVGNALVALAIAVGIAFRFFDNEDVIRYVSYAIPIFMLVIAAEIVLNFILNMYRPRVTGEVPRPAFDSRLLSLVSTPDSIVRTINEAVNYQFGFDITSSWGYQLLLRSIAWLLTIGVLAIVALNMMVVVESHQQAVKLAGGKIVGNTVHHSGIMWKLPWPFQSAEVYDVTRVQKLALTAQEQFDDFPASLWEGKLRTDVQVEPFIVASSPVQVDRSIAHRVEEKILETEMPESAPVTVGDEAGGAKIEELADPEVSEKVAGSHALVDAVISLHYRIKSKSTGSDEDGLLDYLQFASDMRRPREELTERERALRLLAMREISSQLAQMKMDDVLFGSESGRAGLVAQLHKKVQAAFDARKTGVEVVAINVPVLRPSGGMAENYVDLMIAHQQREELVSQSRQRELTTLVHHAGSLDNAEVILAEIDQWNKLKDSQGVQAAETVDQRLKIEKLLQEGGGLAIAAIDHAERDRWVQLMASRSQVNRVLGELAAYKAAPRLYRERATMSVLVRNLDLVRKIVVGIDPSKLSVDVDLKELDQFLNMAPQDTRVVETDQGG